MTAWLERVATLLIRLHGRAFAATYGADLLDTMRERGRRARAKGASAFVLFVIRELGSLGWSAIVQRVPQWDAPRSPAGRRGLSTDAVLREFRHAARRLRRAPGFTASVVVTLGLAIAATTTVFTLVSSIVLAPLAYPASARLIDLDHAAPALGLASGMGMSIGLAREYEALPSIEDVALYTVQAGTLADSGPARRATYLQVTPSLGSTLGIQMQSGRWFTAAEGVTGAPLVAVLSDAMWRQQFGAAASVIGRQLRMEGRSHEIVGVLTPDSAFPGPEIEFMVPLPLPAVWTRATGFNYSAVAAIAPGTTIDQVRRDQRAVIATLSSRFPADAEIGTIVEGGLRPVTRTLKDALVGDVSTTLWALLGAAALVLLMACANLANLFLVRYESRHREVSVQRALGAGAADLAAHVLAETVLVAAAGAALGYVMSVATVDAIVRWGPQGLPRLHDVQVGPAGAAFTVATAIAVGVLIGLVPLLRLAAKDRSPLAGAERGGTPPPVRMATRHALLVAQLALAVVVTIVAGLLTRSFANVLRVDPGFESESRLVFDASLPRAEYRTRAEAAAFHTMVLERLRMLPGAVSAAVISNLPLEGLGIGDPLEVRGRLLIAAEAAPIVRYRRVSIDYFATLGIPLHAGRGFDALDDDGGADAAIIDEATAQLYFPNEDPIGRQIRPRDSASPDRWLTIVGVVGNTATVTLSETNPIPKMYVPLRAAMWADVPSPHSVSYVIRTGSDPIAHVAAIRGALAGLNPRIALARAERLDDVMTRARAPRALTMILLLVAAGMAMIVGTVGVYAVMSYAVAQRSVEIGVRLAVGATPPQVTALIVRDGARVIGVGIAAGLALTIALASLVESLLFGVAPLDWPTHAAVAAIITLVAVAASWWPAVRATSRDPLRSLR